MLNILLLNFVSHMLLWTQGNPCNGIVSGLDLFSLNLVYCAGQ